MNDHDLRAREPAARHTRRVPAPAGCLAAIVALAAPASPAAVAEGERLLASRCGGCHAVTADTASPLPEAPPFDTLGAEYPPAHLAEALAEGIVTGHAGMPETRFTPHEIDVVLAYLHALTAPAPRRRPDG